MLILRRLNLSTNNDVKIIRLSKERFEAFIAYTRHPNVLLISNELGYWADSNERVLGLLSFDLIDKDFSVVILARDEKRKFRAIDIEASIENMNQAKEKLFNKIKEWATKPDSDYWQGGDEPTGIDLFQILPDVDESRLHPSYKALRNLEGYSPARGIIAEIMPHYIDIDKNQFVKQFQTDGFDQRLWELYLFCFFNEELFIRNTQYNRPDFFLNKYGEHIGIEAVTLGPVANRENVPDTNNSEAFTGYIRKKFERSLKRKLDHQSPYWDETHMENIPLIFAMADFHFGAEIKEGLKDVEPPSLALSKNGLIECLYGYKINTQDDNQELIPIEDDLAIRQNRTYGFFNETNAEKVSAVVYTNVGTIAKFNRMGKIAGFGSDNVNILQMAEIYNPSSTNEHSYKMRKILPNMHEEFWGDGINIFHNPKAERPLVAELFPNAVHYYLEDAQIVAYYSANTDHLLSSFQITVTAQ